MTRECLFRSHSRNSRFNLCHRARIVCSNDHANGPGAFAPGPLVPRYARLLRVYRAEQELERLVRLSAERDVRGEHEQLARAHLRLDADRTTFEEVLTPRPTAAQRFVRFEPHH